MVEDTKEKTKLVKEALKKTFEDLSKMNTEIDTDSMLVIVQDMAHEVFSQPGMPFEESLANVNKTGKQSIILELDPRWSPFLSSIVTSDVGGDLDNTTIDVLQLLDGQAGEDYLITGDHDSSHDAEQLENICSDHEIFATLLELESILKTFAQFLRKRVVTWG